MEETARNERTRQDSEQPSDSAEFETGRRRVQSSPPKPVSPLLIPRNHELSRSNNAEDSLRPEFYLDEETSPSPSKSPAFTFGTDECLPKAAKRPVSLQRTNSLLSRKGPKVPTSPDADSLCSFAIRPPAFGSRRRMSRSLPELRDITFVSVLPDLEEEESDNTEVEGELDLNYEKPTRAPWHRKLDFVVCSVCQSLGLGNFWRFPYYCYSNGGGTFVLAYIILMLICGVPLLCMEFGIGQLTQAGPISAFGQLCPLMKGIGVASTMLSFWLTTYYSVLVSWTLFYTFNSFYSPPRWTRCTNTWNSEDCRDQAFLMPMKGESSATTILNSLNTSEISDTSDIFVPSTMIDLYNDSDLFNASEIAENMTSFVTTFKSPILKNFTHPAVEFVHLKMLETSKEIGEPGELRFELLAAVLFVWCMTYFALRKTDFFRGTTIYFLTMASYLLLFSIFLRTIALEGAKNGFRFLFQPDWKKITEARVWLYALAQAFHSLGVILGPSIIMGSCHKSHNNILRDTIILTSITLLTVILVSCVAFGTLGHLALKLSQPIDKVLDDTPATVFIIYSVVIGSMPVPSFWGVIFFLVFLGLGLDSQIKLMATLISALKEAYTFCIKQRFQGHSVFLAAVCGICFVATVLYLTQAGIYYLQLVDHYVAVLAVVVLALLEVCTIGWLYGSTNLAMSIQQMIGKTPSYFYRISWTVLSPGVIIAILGYSATTLKGDSVRKSYVYPTWAHIVGWVFFCLTLCWVPFLAIAAYRKAPKLHVLSRINFILQPKNPGSNSAWEPKPVIIMNESTMGDDYSDYKMTELPSLTNSMQSYAFERHSTMTSEKRDNDTSI